MKTTEEFIPSSLLHLPSSDEDNDDDDDYEDEIRESVDDDASIINDPPKGDNVLLWLGSCEFYH